jgi:hypothetical protein
MFIPDKKDLPILIHGKEGRGASFFSIKLVSGFVKKNNPLIFWSAYPMAKQEFKKELNDNVPPNVIIIENENPAELNKILLEIDVGQTLFVKNFEVIPSEIRKMLLKRKLLVIAGDLEKALTRDEVLKFPIRIFFSPYLGIKIPNLKKYQGYIFSNNENGFVSLS